MIMNRDELVSSIIASVGALTDTQIALVNQCLSDIILAVEIRRGYEILITELSEENIELVKAECIRRYRSG